MSRKLPSILGIAPLLILGVAFIVISASAQEKEKTIGFEEKSDKHRPNPCEKKAGREWAIIVGVGHYKDRNISPLKRTVADAEAIYQVLTGPRVRGYPKSQVYLFTDRTLRKPTRGAILEGLRTVLDRAEPDDLVLFYFSGHGIDRNGEVYLLPQDADTEFIDDTTLRLKTLKDRFAKLKAKSQVIILDACHSGSRRSDAYDGIIKTVATSSGVSFVILSSSEGAQKSYEDEELGHGVYTNYLLEALRGIGTADQNGNYEITVREAHEYVEEKVGKWAKAKKRPQSPRLYSDIGKKIVLTIPNRIDVSEKDGAEMVLIAGGTFTMGNLTGKVTLNDYYIDRHEVTNRQYQMFLKATGYEPPQFWGKDGFANPDQPVVGVSWYDARTYARWVGRNLPTEAEWENAARGPEKRLYPWGNSWAPSRIVTQLTSVKINIADESLSGVRGMGSNVAEWVTDQAGAACGSRGGSWRTPNVWNTTHNQNRKSNRFDDVGFRLVKRVTAELE
jgi:formylglycine-generating enzyme required for sulfatase activity